MGADDPGTPSHGQNVRRDRAAKPLMRFRWHDGADEALARCPYHQRQTELAQFIEPGQHRDALLRGFAETDAGVEHDVAPGNARPCCDVERASEKRLDIPDDID